MLQGANDIIHADWRITSRQLAVQLSVSIVSARAITDALGYSKVCARWVPQSLTTEHRRQRKAICSELLEHFDAEWEAFLSWIITGDETWAHHYDMSQRRKGRQWSGIIRNHQEKKVQDNSFHWKRHDHHLLGH
jgi:hypothetical protein